MEDYLQYMKTLRSQMNEVEDQAAKISVDEQMYLTTIQNLENELDFVKYEKKRLTEETDHFMKEKGLICSRILENRRKVSSLGLDSSTLSQTLELIQNERDALSVKLVERSTYYSKTFEEMTKQLNEQQTWIIANKHVSFIGGKSVATQLEDKAGSKSAEVEVSQGNRMKSLMMKLDASKADLDRMTHLKTDLHLENIKPELREMDVKVLEEELQALLSDKAGEIEYLQSLQLQIKKMKEISHAVKCSCGMEYKVELGPVHDKLVSL